MSSAKAAPAKPVKKGKTVPFYAFRIELKDIRPKIWRYFYVRSDISLLEFHDVIQRVMGWSNYHLFSFRIHGEDYYVPGEDGFGQPATAADGATHKTLKTIRLNKLYLSKGDTFQYLYDMGDDWEHVVKVLDTDYSPKVPGTRAGCYRGARACPPEDCGGVWGYSELLEILAHPEREEYEERMECIEEGFDPEAFDMDTINQMLLF
jgi:hypothetical protein